MEEFHTSSRRIFIGKTLAGLGALQLGTSMPAMSRSRIKSVTILHTNDVHSHIDPFENNHPDFPGRGGVARRASLIRQIRREVDDVLLFDSGDMFQGTPYFNMFGGEPELKLMSLMGYDAATIGNHDFDNGIDALAAVSRYAKFPLLNVNYEFNQTSMENKCVPYKIFEKSGIRIGVFGLGIKLDGLVGKHLTGKTEYKDPVEKAQYWSTYLKSRKRCHLAICLSHLGYQYKDDRISDVRLAENCSDLDLILGGHTHTFLDEPIKFNHKNGKQVLIAQAGWAGLRLGRIDFHFHAGTGLPESVTYDVKDF